MLLDQDLRPDFKDDIEEGQSINEGAFDGI